MSAAPATLGTKVTTQVTPGTQVTTPTMQGAAVTQVSNIQPIVINPLAQVPTAAAGALSSSNSSQIPQITPVTSGQELIQGSIRWGRVLKGTHKFFCDVCQKPFTKKNDMKTHQKISCLNKGEKNYKCTSVGCNKSFAYEQSLKDHMNKNHTGLKPYKCDYCATSFATNNEAVNHRKGCAMRFYSPSLQDISSQDFSFIQ